MIRTAASFAAALCAAALSAPLTTAEAAPQNPATAQFNVTITILKQCTVTAPATIKLGSVGATDLIATTPSATQPFTVTCSLGTGYKVGFSSPNDLATGSATHQMRGTVNGNASVVQYDLFDATANAGNTAALSASTSVISDTGTGVSQSKVLRAQVVNYTAAATPDTYSDTVTMTVTY